MAPSTEYTRVEDTNEDHGGEGLLKRDDKHSSVHSGHVSTNKSDDILQSQHEIFLQWGLGSDGSGNITPLEEHEPAGASVGNWDDSYKTDQSTSSGVSEGQVQNKPSTSPSVMRKPVGSAGGVRTRSGVQSIGVALSRPASLAVGEHNPVQAQTHSRLLPAHSGQEQLCGNEANVCGSSLYFHLSSFLDARIANEE